MVAGLGYNGGRNWKVHDLPLDGRIAVVARVRSCGPFAFFLTQAYEPPLVTGQVRPLLAAKHLSVVGIVFYQEDEDGGEDEGEAASAEEGYEVPESRWERRGRGEVRHDHGWVRVRVNERGLYRGDSYRVVGWRKGLRRRVPGGVAGGLTG